jgi:curved DNA-binding protein CbpA
MRNEQFKNFNCYTVLSVSLTASPQEIKLAWRAASMIAHPDRGGSNEAQQRVNIAYEVLSDPIQKRQHDIFWSVGRPADKRAAHTNERPRTNGGERAAQYDRARRDSEPLRGFQSRLDEAINRRRSEIWSQLDSRTNIRVSEFYQKYRSARQSAFLWAGIAAAALLIAYWKPALWFAPAGSLAVLWAKSGGPRLGNQTIGLFESISDEDIRRRSREEVAQSCDREAKAFDKFNGYFASVLDLALRPSSFDDSEDQVARRLVVAFFFSGYMPEAYDAQNRIITLADGDERIAIRFRHRSGAAVNVAYLKGLVERTDRRAILFCSPGLSGNAAEYASKHGVRWYTLETMNAWINDVLRNDASGPTGDILKHIESLHQFVSGISTRVGFSRPRYRRRRWR